MQSRFPPGLWSEKNIDFEKLRGLVGIFGKNYSGKSSIVDSLLFAMFNSTSKGERKNVHIINQNKDSSRAKIQIEVGNETLQVCRNLNKYEKKVKIIGNEEEAENIV